MKAIRVNGMLRNESSIGMRGIGWLIPSLEKNENTCSWGETVI